MRTGVYGGSFDPIHCGHLILARELMTKAGLDRVILLPTHISPFKQNALPVEAQHRINMIKLAISDYPDIVLSTLEIEENRQPSYTYDTWQLLKKQYKDDELFFLCGMDTFREIKRWYRFSELVKEIPFIVAFRPGFDEKEFLEFAGILKKSLDDRLRFEYYHIDEKNISSSDIRECLKNGASLEKLVPKAVEDYIRENRLYV